MPHGVYFFINNDLLSDKNWKKNRLSCYYFKKRNYFYLKKAEFLKTISWIQEN